MDRTRIRPRTRRNRRGLDWSWGAPLQPLESRLLPSASVNVLTYHNNAMRTGVNPNETVLTPATVNAARFGKVAEVGVDGQVYAQPLYRSNQAIPGRGVHDVVYVATEHDSVYAFDAHTLKLLWHDRFVNPARGVTTVPSDDVRTFDLTPEIGITGTPVIDPSTNALYVVAKTKEVSGGTVQYVQRLHVLDLGTGREKFGGPVAIQASVAGRGVGSVGGRVSFDPLWEFQRSGLLLLNGTVYITWASQADNGPFHGWVIGYNDRTLRQVSVLNTTPNGSDGGIWMSGGAPAVDASGHIYLASGNGTFSADRRGKDYGNSVLKLNPGNLSVADYFTPFNQSRLNVVDQDLGSGGVLLLPDQPGPHRHLLVTAGKEGRIYLIDRDSLGRFSRRADDVVQELPHALNASFDTPAYYNGVVYYVGTGSRLSGPQAVLTALPLVNGQLSTTPAQGRIPYGYPGSTPSISSKGAAGGIVWTLDNGGAAQQRPAILRAYPAGNVTRELYDSNQAGTRDQAGPAVKFSVPTVANGRVYVGGNQTLTVYGLRHG